MILGLLTMIHPYNCLWSLQDLSNPHRLPVTLKTIGSNFSGFLMITMTVTGKILKILRKPIVMNLMKIYKINSPSTNIVSFSCARSAFYPEECYDEKKIWHWKCKIINFTLWNCFSKPCISYFIKDISTCWDVPSCATDALKRQNFKKQISKHF